MNHHCLFSQQDLDLLKPAVRDMVEHSTIQNGNGFNEETLTVHGKWSQRPTLIINRSWPRTGDAKTIAQAILAGLYLAEGKNTMWMVNDEGDVKKFVDERQNITNISHQELLSLVVEKLTGEKIQTRWSTWNPWNNSARMRRATPHSSLKSKEQMISALRTPTWSRSYRRANAVLAADDHRVRPEQAGDEGSRQEPSGSSGR